MNWALVIVCWVAFSLNAPGKPAPKFKPNQPRNPPRMVA
jgi:hypothetical protein